MMDTEKINYSSVIPLKDYESQKNRRSKSEIYEIVMIQFLLFKILVQIPED